jgi:DNA-binding LytR/AlgR family response regulator
MTESSERLRALVVDDEPLARALVAKLLRTEPGVEICGIESSGRRALAAIREQIPDVVFIDIRMPDLDGIGVIRRTASDAAPLDAVRYFEACNQYVRVHLGDASYLLSTESLASLEEQVAPDTFFRVHRSFLVNRRFVASVVANAGGGSSVVLENGRRLPVARRSREVAERLLVRVAERPDLISGGK